MHKSRKHSRKNNRAAKKRGSLATSVQKIKSDDTALESKTLQNEVLPLVVEGNDSQTLLTSLNRNIHSGIEDEVHSFQNGISSRVAEKKNDSQISMSASNEDYIASLNIIDVMDEFQDDIFASVDFNEVEAILDGWRKTEKEKLAALVIEPGQHDNVSASDSLLSEKHFPSSEYMMSNNVQPSKLGGEQVIDPKNKEMNDALLQAIPDAWQKSEKENLATPGIRPGQHHNNASDDVPSEKPFPSSEHLCSEALQMIDQKEKEMNKQLPQLENEKFLIGDLNDKSIPKNRNSKKAKKRRHGKLRDYSGHTKEKRDSINHASTKDGYEKPNRATYITASCLDLKGFKNVHVITTGENEVKESKTVWCRFVNPIIKHLRSCLLPFWDFWKE